MEGAEEEQSTTIKRAFVRCGVCGCDVTTVSHPRYTFYSIPKCPSRKILWMKALNLNPADLAAARIRVCEKHFESKYININTKRRRLYSFALPTLHLPGNENVSSFAKNDDFPNSEEESIYSDYAALNNEEEMSEEQIAASNISVNSDYIYPSINKVATLPVKVEPMDPYEEVPVKVEPIDPEVPSTSSCTFVMPVKRTQNESFENTRPTKLVKIKQEKNYLTVFVDEDNEEEYNEDAVIADQLEYVAEFQNQQNLEVKEKSASQKYTTDYKMCALELYFKSPNSYRLFQRTFTLPKISTLYRLCIPTTTELNHELMWALGIKVKSMTAAQKECVVCIGTMRLTPTIEYDAVNDKMFGFQEVGGAQTLQPAKSVLVIMVRGLLHNWKQALGFSFISHFQNRSEVNVFLNEIMRKLLYEVKLNVRVLMTDIESDMDNAAWGFDVKSPFFFIGSKKIYYMYEPLNLMNNVRDHFIHNTITFYNGLVAKFNYVVQAYTYDRKKCLMRIAPKLTEDHVLVNEAKLKDDLQHTADIFSRATATAISTCIDLKVLETRAKDTSLWVLTMSQLLDVLNFSTVDPPDDSSAVYSGKKNQVEFLVEMITMFSSLQTINAVFKDGFVVTINALLLLYEELKTDYKDCPPLVGLSHDCLNHFFKKCRNGMAISPTAKQTVMSITKFPIFNVFQYSLKKRSPRELEVFLSQVRQMPDVNIYDEDYAEPYVDTCAAASAEFPAVPLTKDNKLEHLALYLLYKGYRAHCECEYMKVYVRSKDIIENTNCLMPLVGYKTKICGSKYKLVPEEFVAFIEALEVKFKEYFKTNLLTRSIAALQSFIKNVTFRMPCECFPLHYIKHLYLRYRLYYVLEYNNAIFRDENCKAAFVVNDL